jgi:NitT/TauT family transport system substrate-binding protein
MGRLRLFGALAVCLLASEALHAQQSAPEQVTLAVPGTAMTFSPGYVAEDLGLFARQGLNVKSVIISGIGSTNAVIAGSADFGEISGPALTRAAAHGQRLLAIANTLNRPTVMIVLRKELAGDVDPKAPLEQRAALMKGRTIAVDSINSIVHAYVLLIGARGHYDPNEIRVAPLQPVNAITAFNAHQVDGFAMSMPWPLQLVLDGTAVAIASGTNGDPPDMVPFAHNLFVAKPETCEKRKSVCEKMGRAIAEATAIIRDRPADVLALLKKRFPTFDDKLLAAGFDEVRKGTPSPPIVAQAALENSERLNVDAGLLKPEDKLKSCDGLFTDQYVK